MLHYERVVFEDAIAECKVKELERLLEINNDSIIRYSNKRGIETNTIKQQVRLIAPQFNYSLFSDNESSKLFFAEKIVPILERRFLNYASDLKDYKANAGINQLKGEYKIVRNASKWQLVNLDNGSKVEALMKEVNDENARFIEERLHYLRSPRNDAFRRVGLYIEGYQKPIFYLSFSKIDRPDKVDALEKAIDCKVNTNRVLELSRVFGFGDSIINAASCMLGHYSRDFRQLGYDYIITAVNFTLGFSGASMVASGFIPFATRPVLYRYDNNSEYCTRRVKPNAKESPNKMPPNILFVKEIKNVDGNDVQYCNMVSIADGFSFISEIEHELVVIRKELENLWNEQTRYPGIIGTPQKKSKGQCGVSSLLLAKILEEKGYDVLYCEGNAYFRGKNNIDKGSITHHCWLKICECGCRKKSVIIDITADQNGYSKPIIFMAEDDLKKAHMSYKVISEKKPCDVNVSHLIQRLEYLENARKEYSKKEGENRI